MLADLMDPPDAEELPDRCKIAGPASGQDGDGAPNTAPGPATAETPCSVQNPSSTRGTIYENTVAPQGVELKQMIFGSDPRIGVGSTLATTRNVGDSAIALATGGGLTFPASGLAILRRASDGGSLLLTFTAKSGDALTGCTLAQSGLLGDASTPQVDSAFAIGDAASPFTPIFAESVLWWTRNARGPLSSPIAMNAQGCPESPGGLRARYTLTVEIRT